MTDTKHETNQNASHTQGPWHIANYASSKGELASYDDIHFGNDKQNRICRLFTSDNGYETQRANARLIASSPKLLKALENALALAGSPSPLWDEARSAIAEAKGRASV